MSNYGRAGNQVRVKTNSFEIRTLPKKTFYQYDVVAQQSVDGSPPKVLPAGRRYREIIDRMQDTHPTVFMPRASFDGSKILYSSKSMQAADFEVNMSSNTKSKSGRFFVKITPVAPIQPSDLQRLITAGGALDSKANSTAVNLLQIIISQAPNVRHNFALHSKSFYINTYARALPSGLEAWTGFFQSVRPVLNKIVVNVDTTTAAVYKPGNLLSSAMEVSHRSDIREFVRLCQTSQQAWQKLCKFFKGVRVTVACSKKRGPIAELIPEGGLFEFSKDGGKLTVQEHFRAQYGLHIREPKAFGVRIGKDAVFPAELCEVAPGQVYKKKLDPADTIEFMRLSVKKPVERMNAIRDAVGGNVLNYTNSPWMNEAGMTVSSNPLEITGRELKAPTVVYADSQLNVRGGAWNVVGRRFQVPAKILAWAVVCFDSSPNAEGNVQRLGQALLGNLQKLGIMFFIARPYIAFGNQGNVHASLANAASEVKKVLENDPKCPAEPRAGFILCVLPQNAAVLRKEVKQWSDMMTGIPTQCVRQGKYEKANDQYCNNLALKINIKCGGQNSFVLSNANALLNESMIVGCDVSHPSPGVFNRPSVASVVTSIDRQATRYHVAVNVQAPRQEIIDDIGAMVQAGLVDYRSVHKTFPKNLVVFRDGVSEGEYSQLESTEIKTLEDLLLDLQNRTDHKMTLIFIVVGKRHHVRFFPTDQAQGDRSGNCNPGLVIDREIVHSSYMDFYLQSHSGILGTSRPSHYVVLKNTAGWSADQLQELSYALCHVYGAATRSVSIPAPVYYADRVCARAEYQFRPELEFSDENSSNADFDLQIWKKGFAQSMLRRNMYFV